MTTTPESFIDNLVMGDNGFLRAKEASDVSYPEDGHDICHAVESTSFWFGHRNRALRAVLERHPAPKELPFVDVGGGNGFVAQMIQDLGYRTVMVEPGEAGVRFARERGVDEIVQASIVDLDVRPASIGGIGLFDVLEHIEDDVAALRNLRGMLAPGGRLYLTVPAHKALWSTIDVKAGHYRRYNRRTLGAALRAAGFDVPFLSYYFWPLPAPMYFLRCLPERLNLRRGESREQRVSREHERSSPAVQRALDMEIRRFSEGRGMPVGASLLAVAENPEAS